MFRGLFRASTNRALIDKVHGKIVAAARQPVLYLEYGVPDTREGRFEMVALHAVLLLRRLRGCAAPGPAMAQAVSDAVFRNFDANLREMGVGDPSVPKRIKSLAEAFMGRCTAYEAALAQPGPAVLEAALLRNVYAPHGSGMAGRLARYVHVSAVRLDAESPQSVALDTNPFTDAGETL